MGVAINNSMSDGRHALGSSDEGGNGWISDTLHGRAMIFESPHFHFGI